jgi:subtilase family serine protease
VRVLTLDWARFGSNSGRKFTRGRSKQRRLSRAARVELLETRTMLDAAATLGQTVISPILTGPQNGIAPDSSSPVGLTPVQIRGAYGISSIADTGAGQTVAIVDAYDDPNIQTDLNTFDTTFALPATTIQKLNENGGTTLPGGDPDYLWEGEECLDVEWAHAIAPGAQIVLVEATNGDLINSQSFDDLTTAVNTARDLPGVSVVTMSWGFPESLFTGNGSPGAEHSFDTIFTTPAGHQGVTFVASTGDYGVPGGYPAFSPNVLAVGGTTLTVGGGNTYGSETGWSRASNGTGMIPQQAISTSSTMTKAGPAT